jgi:hypothetical protein
MSMLSRFSESCASLSYKSIFKLYRFVAAKFESLANPKTHD